MEKRFPPFPPAPQLPPTEVFLPYPGEPDSLAEARLRQALRIFRTLATVLETMQAFAREPLPKAFRGLIGPKFPPELEKMFEEYERKAQEPGGIWSPEAIAERREAVRPFLDSEKPQVKERLLAIERTFIERGWRLPRWERPIWLVEHLE